MHQKIFQVATLNRALTAQNQHSKEKMAQAYAQFSHFFANIETQNNIKASNEEQFQEGFLHELFVKTLGYTLNPNPGYNLTTEYRNLNDARKADAAILDDRQKPLAIIELKGCDTTDLSKAESQAFGYKSYHRGVRYVIVSNFHRLRFYIDDATEYLEFNLFALSASDFERLWLCLAAENLLKGLAGDLKDQSVVREKEITNQLYADYSNFKRLLFDDLLRQNPNIEDKLLLFKKTQKLIDRLLFIFFAEDRGLLPPNTIITLHRDRDKISALWQEIPLYDYYKRYFGLLNTGDPENKVFAYNGGLFAPDPTLDSLIISDDVLREHTERLSAYDFASEVSVNILGHIFEHSLSEIEELQRRIEANDPTLLAHSSDAQIKEKSATETQDKRDRKRNCDGVFYTPAYITHYITEESLGQLCREKKASVQIDDERYSQFISKKGQREQAYQTLQTYRQWLSNVKICDPACGSGAFLNAALAFLNQEHQLIDQYQNTILGHSLPYQNYDAIILENNLYGVDINPESIEIAKLSLWLHTAQYGRKLSSLNDNIVCGNSLINDPELDPQTAFDWQKTFPEVFANGGFDVIIGNPPYVQLQAIPETSQALAQAGYESFNKSADLYCLFVERGCQILKENGYLGYIIPNKWMITKYGEELRQYLKPKNITHLLNFGDIQFFQDATIYPCILILKNDKAQTHFKGLSVNQSNYNDDFDATVREKIYDINRETLGNAGWFIAEERDLPTLEKLATAPLTLKDLPIEINYGIKTGYNDAFYIDSETRKRLIDADPKCETLIRPLLRGRDLIPYGKQWEDLWMINTHNGIKKDNIPAIDIKNFPSLKSHLDLFWLRLKKRGDQGETPYNLRNCTYIEEFDRPKIIYPNMTSVFPFMYDESGMLTNQKCFIITSKSDAFSLHALNVILNADTTKRWIWYNCPELIGGTREISKVYFEHLPLPDLLGAANAASIERLAQMGEDMTWSVANAEELRARFLRRLYTTFGERVKKKPFKASQKLQTFECLKFSGLISEINKQLDKGETLKLSEQDAWETYFGEYRQALIDAKRHQTIVREESELLVRQLYGFEDD